MSLICNRSFFEYWDEAPHDWQRLLQAKADLGDTVITIPILWGVHETSLGIRDFSKQSKLRIEKLLAVAQSVGLSVRVVLGFPAHPLTFPSWAIDEGQREIIPKTVWEDEPPYFSSVSLPSPKAPRLKEGFYSFFEEVGSILSLYVAPGGPISEVHVSLLPLLFSQSISGESGYSKCLEKRYPDVKVFNKRFQTNYNNLNAVATKAGAKLIESKRPWLFAYDYRWSRFRLAEEYLTGLLALKTPEGLQSLILASLKMENLNAQENKKAAVCFESTLIQCDESSGISPFMAEGVLSKSSIQAFQWASVIRESLKDTVVDFIPLPILSGDSTQNYSVMTVISGKYLSLSGANYLIEQLKNGSLLFFPFGVPQFDENLESHQLFNGGARSLISLGGADWFKISKEKGAIYLSSQTTLTSSPDWIKIWTRNFGDLAEGLLNG
ncbi:MAG: beta-galactosidase [Proteobacteria bacterium]|nr:beta-galactosidase [Pseudomonadota bacterium]